MHVVSLARSIQRREALRSSFAQHNLTRFEFEDAIDGRADWREVPTAARGKGSRLFRHSALPIEALVSEAKPGVESSPGLSAVAATLSHLSAICTAYAAGEEQALIVEDDVSLELVPHWGVGTLDALVAALEAESDSVCGTHWAVVQLAVTILPEHGRRLMRMAEQHQLGKLVQRRDPIADLDLWCAAGYLVSRHGMESLLARHWPGGTAGCAAPPRVGLSGRFDLGASKSAVADALVFSAPCTFYANRPLFTYQVDEPTTIQDERRGGVDDVFWEAGMPQKEARLSLTASSKRAVADAFYCAASSKQTTASASAAASRGCNAARAACLHKLRFNVAVPSFFCTLMPSTTMRWLLTPSWGSGLSINYAAIVLVALGLCALCSRLLAQAARRPLAAVAPKDAKHS